MSDDVWSAQGTSPNAVAEGLRELLAVRHADDGGYAPARTLNLVVIADRQFRGEIENRLERVGRALSSRVILCAVEHGRDRLDAVAAMHVDDAIEGAEGIHVASETVELSVGDRHLPHLDTIVDPLIVSDLSTVVWAPHGHARGVDALTRLAQVVLVDSMDEPGLRAGLDRATELAQRTYVVDLAWLRSAPWRERIAAIFDPPQFRGKLADIAGITVRHRHDSQAAAVLLLGWLAARLGWRPSGLTPVAGGLRGTVRARRGEVKLATEEQSLSSPGLGGVTIAMASGSALSLDRGPGGLRAVRRFPDGTETTWRALGASRGEVGILGEGVRQALLRDRVYAQALAAARELVA